MLFIIMWGLSMLDGRSLAARYSDWRTDQVLRSAERTLQSVDRTMQKIAESKKRAEALDQEWRKNHDEINELLKKLKMPPLAPLPPKETVKPG